MANDDTKNHRINDLKSIVLPDEDLVSDPLVHPWTKEKDTVINDSFVTKVNDMVYIYPMFSRNGTRNYHPTVLNVQKALG